MKHAPISVSEEYIDTLCDNMLEWAQQEDSYIVSEFQESYGLSWFYLNSIRQNSIKAHRTFDLMKALLCNRWFKMAMTVKDMPPHKAKVLMRYLRLYDSHGLQVEREMRGEEAAAKSVAMANMVIEDYGKEAIPEPFNKFYDENIDKRRD